VRTSVLPPNRQTWSTLQLPPRLGRHPPQLTRQLQHRSPQSLRQALSSQVNAPFSGFHAVARVGRLKPILWPSGSNWRRNQRQLDGRASIKTGSSRSGTQPIAAYRARDWSL
jgi:hypothetical protein